MKRSIFYMLFPLLILLACGSGPKTEPVTVEDPLPPAPVEEVTPEPAAAQVFDPLSISQEVFDSTKVDIKKFIEDLNRIISSRNYDAWVSHLGSEYFSRISSRQYLDQVSAQPSLKSRSIRLNTAKDYFTQVVVPSRANARVDDIEFLTQTRVKALTIAPNGERLRLYELENSQNTWKIIN
jgi:hypothetical protein